MAGDWIPMRLDLPDDPAVIAIAAALGLDEHAVVGRLHRLWSWANRHLSSGNAACVTEQWVDRYVSAPGFAAAMLNAGWLRTRSGGVEFPNFDRWNSQGAKRRVLTAQRVKRSRAASGNAPSVTEALPEKRREEKRTTEDPTGGATAKPPPAAKVPKSPRERKPPSGPHAEAVSIFVASWRERYGDKYPFDGAKDGAAMSAILTHVGGDLDKLRAIVSRYFANDEAFFAGHTIAKLRSQLPQFLVDAAPAAPPRNRYETQDEKTLRLIRGAIDHDRSRDADPYPDPEMLP